MHDSMVKAERAVVGAMIRDIETAWRVVEIIRADMLTSAFCRSVFTAVTGLMQENRKPGITILMTRMAEEAPDGMPMEMALSLLITESEDGGAVDLAYGIEDAWRRRKAVEIAQKFQEEIGKSLSNTDDVLAKISSMMADLTATGQDGRDKPLSGVISQVLSEAGTAVSGDYVPGFDTGLYPLDHILGRIMPGDLGAIGGAPGHGKTALGVQIALRASETRNVAIFELEMADKALARRLLAAEADVSAGDIETGAFDFAAYDRLKQAEAKLSAMKMSIIDTPKMTIQQIAARCKSLKRTNGLDMIVLDHLKLIGSSSRHTSKWDRMEEVCGEAKSLAKELNIAVIMLSQVTKESQRRENPEPIITDLDGGGALEQYADWAISIFRRDRWIKTTKINGGINEDNGKWWSKFNECQGQAELYPLKRRRGDIENKSIVKFNGRASRFEALE